MKRQIASSFRLPASALAFAALLGLCALFSILDPQTALAAKCGREAQLEPCELVTYGGPGGGDFRHVCDAGYYLQAIGATAGSYVDSVQAYCRQFDGEKTFGSARSSGWFGGPGGGNASASCPNGVVKALRVTGAMDDDKINFVRGFRATCTDVAKVQCGGRCPSEPGDRHDFNECPEGMVGVGLWGKHGIYVDSLGLICGPGPAFLAAVAGEKAAKQAAANAAYLAQREYEMKVTGKSTAECATSNQSCEARIMATFGPLTAPGMIPSECTPYFAMCMNNAGAALAASQKAYADARSFETQVTGRTVAECHNSNQACELRIRATFGPLNALGIIPGECTPYLQMCMNNAAQAAAAAAAAAAPPPPVEVNQPPAPFGGGTQMASTCDLPGGTATVVIANPSLTTLNVRDKPMGNIIGKPLPEGTQVNVVGGCGIELSAGIVAQQGGSKPPVPGWCAISSPRIGCVSEQFLVAGIPAGGQAGLPPTSAGIVATKPQPGNSATVELNVDIYSQPGGGGVVVGRLAKGTQGVLANCQPDNWCQVSQWMGNAPSHMGWVYNGPDYNSLKF